MKLHSPVFEKALRQGVRAAVQAAPELRKEQKRVGRGRQVVGAWRQIVGLRLGLLLIQATAIAATFGITRKSAWALLVLNLWMLVSFCSSLIFDGRNALSLSFLPVADATIARWEFTKYFRRSFSMLAEWAVGLGTLGLVLHLSAEQWLIVIVVAPLAWFHLLALATFLIFRWPGLPYRKIAFVLFLSTLTGWLLGKFLESQTVVVAGMSFFAAIVNFLLPTGWPLALLSPGTPSFHWWMLLPLLPMTALLVMFRSWLRQLEGRFKYVEAEFDGVEISGESPIISSASTEPRPAGITEIQENLLSGEWLARKRWPEGWLESRLWNRLSEREKDLADFTFPGGLEITRTWRSLFGYFVVIAFFGGVGCLLSPVLGWWIYGPAFSFLILAAFLNMQKTGRAFGRWAVSGVSIPYFAAYPIGHREISNLILKCSNFQMPLLALLIMACFLAVTPCTHMEFVFSILLSLPVVVVCWGGRLVSLAFVMGDASRDKSSQTLRSFVLFTIFGLCWLFYLFLVLCTLVFTVVGGFSGDSKDPFPTLCIFSGLSLITLLIAHLFYRIYQWFYGFLKFDLMRPE